MFGTNPLRKKEQTDGLSLRVQKIWHTIQGEGPFAGCPAVFIRLAGCNLRCYFCDTDFESGYGNVMSVGDVLDQVRSFISYPSLVVITGGEPFRQNILPLCNALVFSSFRTQLETAGTFWVAGLEMLIKTGAVSLVCSPKSGKVHDAISKHCQHWKYLINAEEGVDETDGLPNHSTQIQGERQKLFRPPRTTDTVWLQPCEVYKNTVKALAIGGPSDQCITAAAKDVEAFNHNAKFAALLAMKYNYRISLQLHKILGLE